jgi:hypothetical protein
MTTVPAKPAPSHSEPDEIPSKPRTLEQAADLLFGLMMVGDDRAVEQTWAMGR